MESLSGEGLTTSIWNRCEWLKNASSELCQTHTCRCDHSLPLFNNLRLLKVDNIYKLFMSILAFKCIRHSYVKDLIVPVAHIHNRNTRYAHCNLREPLSRSTLFDNSVISNIASIWNGLPNPLKEMQGLAKFKVNVKRHFLSSQMNENEQQGN